MTQLLKTNEKAIFLFENYILKYKSEPNDILFILEGPDVKLESRDLNTLSDEWARMLVKKAKEQETAKGE